MTYNKQTTLWCDGDDCQDWVQYNTSRVTRAREIAEENEDWECSSDRDLCNDCSGDTDGSDQ